MRQEDATQNSSRFPTGFTVSFFLFLALLFSLYTRGMPPNGDPVNYYVTAAAIADNGRVSLAEKHRYVPMEQGRGGRYYSKFGIGQSLVEAPFYLLARKSAPENASAGYMFSFTYFISTLSVALVSALACVYFMLLAAQLGFSRGASAVTAAILALCTMIFPYAKQGFSEPLQACAIAGAFLYAARARAGESPVNAAMCGAWLGALLLTKTAAAVVVPVFAAYLLFESGSRRVSINNILLFSVSFALFLFAALYYNFVRFEDWFNFGYFSGRDSEMGFNTPLLAGLYGFFFSPGKSMFLYSPVLVLSLVFAGVFHRRRPAESALVWVCSGSMILLYARWWAWHGDWAWGPRFIVPILPLMMLPLAAGVEKFRSLSVTGRAGFAAVVAVSFFIQAMAVTMNYYEYITIVSRQAPHSMFFTPGQEQLRDSNNYTHFVPDFSPVAGQWWLFRHGALNIEETDEEIQGAKETFPWKGLMGYAVPEVSENALEVDTWTVHFPKHYPQYSGWVGRAKTIIWILVAIFLCSMIVSGLRMRRAEE